MSQLFHIKFLSSSAQGRRIFLAQMISVLRASLSHLKCVALYVLTLLCRIGALPTIVAVTFAASANADAVDQAAQIAGVPRGVLESIIKTESGGHAYSLNTNSNLGSFRFKSKQAAEAALLALIQKGYTNIDVGPAQVNLRWHPDLYQHPTDLLDARKNIVAAGYVLKKNKEAGARDLRDIVGRYHSYRPDSARKYADMVLGQSK